MSLESLQLLKMLDLLDSKCHVADVSKVPDSELISKIEYYMRSRKSGFTSALSNPSKNVSSMSAWISSLSSGHTVNSLLPNAVLFEKLQVNDQLFKAIRYPDVLKIGSDPTSGPTLDRLELRNALNHFAALAPLIQSEFVEIVPMNSLHNKPEHVPIYYSEDGFVSQVPPHLYKFIHDAAVIYEVEPAKGGRGVVMTNRTPKKPVRGISVEFREDDWAMQGMFYLYWPIESSKQLDNRELEIRFKLDWDEPLSQADYDAWVTQTVNQVALRRIRQITEEVKCSEQLGCLYLTPSGFEAGLCGRSVQGQGELAVNFLNANATNLNITSPEQIASMRQSNAALFERFRQSLMAVAAELRDKNENFDEEARILFEREIRPQIDEIRDLANRATFAGIKGAMLAVASIGLAVVSTPGIPLISLLGLGTVVGVAEAMVEVKEYLLARKKPSFVWNKFTGK